MFFATADSIPLNGAVVPRNSDTVVSGTPTPYTGSGTAAGGAAGAATGAGAVAPFETMTGVTGAGPLPAAASTSAAVMRPLGPVPTAWGRSGTNQGWQGNKAQRSISAATD